MKLIKRRDGALYGSAIRPLTKSTEVVVQRRVLESGGRRFCDTGADDGHIRSKRGMVEVFPCRASLHEALGQRVVVIKGSKKRWGAEGSRGS